jgi:hypothetical protein
VTDPSSRQRERPTLTKAQLSHSNKNLVLGPRWGLTPRLAGRLTVRCNFTLTSTLLTAISRQRGYDTRTMTVGVQLRKKKDSGRDPQETWRRDELIDGKPQVVKWL